MESQWKPVKFAGTDELFVSSIASSVYVWGSVAVALRLRNAWYCSASTNTAI